MIFFHTIAERFFARSRKPAVLTAAEKFQIKECGGLTLLLDRTNLVDRRILRSGTFERRQRKYLNRLIDQAKAAGHDRFRLLDIGAHWGLYSLDFLMSGKFEEIVAFEADPYNFAQFQAQLMLNNATTAIKAHNCAITQEETLLPWSISTTAHPTNRGGIGVFEAGEMRVQGHRLDTLVAPGAFVEVLKIDVEGHEREVLQGARDLLSQSKAILQIESDGYETAVADWLKPLGYRFLKKVTIDHYFTNIPGLS